MKFKKEFGFTLIELIMVIVILGILAAVAIPKFFNLSGDANEAAEQGVVGGVRAGIQTYMANDTNHSWPAALDPAPNGACSGANPCFVNVLAQGGITSADWSKSGTTYTGPFTGTYTYCVTTGAFQ